MFLEIYRQKLQQAVSDGELSEKDVKSLERLQVLLCIPKQTVEAAHADICGSLFEKASAGFPIFINVLTFFGPKSHYLG